MIIIRTPEEAYWIGTFSNNLRYIMRSKKISAAEIARRTEIPAHKVYKYVRGFERPSDEFVKKIADALECTVDDLLDEEGNPLNF